MISELKIRNFKSLESVDLKLGHFNLLVGANASGKSNFLDVLRFLQGVGSGFSIGEILNGKPQLPTSARWDGIRGGSETIAFRDKDGWETEEVEVEAQIPSGPEAFPGGLNDLYRLKFALVNGVPEIRDELLSNGGKVRFSSANHIASVAGFAAANPSWAVNFRDNTLLSLHSSVAANLAGNQLLQATVDLGFFREEGPFLPQLMLYISRLLADMQFLDLEPSVLRAYSLPSAIPRMGEKGVGFAGLIKYLESQSSDLAALTDWLRELRPDEVESLYTVKAPAGEYMVAIKEREIEFLAPVLSDGTLRFIALAAAFFQPSMPKVLVIEEIEKGLHPSRLRLLVELMRSQSKRTGTQVFATTHSPTVLAWLNKEDRKTTFICTRDEESGATKMRSLSDVLKLEDLIDKGTYLGDLFEQGWLESAPQ